MAELGLGTLNDIDGFQAVALVDSSSGLALITEGSGIDLELAAAGSTEIINANRRATAALGLSDTIEDILISLENAYHILRPLERNRKLFLYLVLDRSRANLAMARHMLKTFENDFDFS